VLWQLLWLALGGLLIGSLGRLAVPGPVPMPWPHTLAAGLVGGVGGGLLAAVVIGRDHQVIGFAVAGLIAVLLVSGYSIFRRSRTLSRSDAV
jgi:uncharacterized membrane protein YeaQ/YmgE (transglycosylase-associated protein family)